jgi:hypothetical protein
MTSLTPQAFQYFSEEVKEASAAAQAKRVAETAARRLKGVRWNDALDAGTLAALAGAGVEGVRSSGYAKDLKYLKKAIKGKDGHKLVDVETYMRERDPTVVVINSSQKISKMLPDLAPKYRAGMEAALTLYFHTGATNAFAFKGKKHGYIIGHGKLPVAIVEHEYGHIVDFRKKGIVMDGSPRMGMYITGAFNRFMQQVWKPSFKKGIYAMERAAWDESKPVGDRHAEIREKALGTYEKGFHKSRAKRLITAAALTTLLRPL